MEFIDKIRSNKITIIFALIVCIFTIMTIYWIKKSTYSLEENEVDSLSITCPETVNAGDTIECRIDAVIVPNGAKKILSINANYSFGSDIKYVSFLLSDDCEELECLSAYAITENGFALANPNGLVKGTTLGYLTIKVPEDAVPDTFYNVGLTNIEYSDSLYEITNLADANTSIKIKSSVATLDSINLNGPVLNEPFDKNTLVYTSNVSSDVDSVIISYVKTDKNSKATGSGTLGEVLSLHYGNNVFNIEVVSEDGKITNNYQINVKREYDFDSSIYKYNKEKNTIYVGGDDDTKILNSLAPLTDGLRYNIDHGKLQILLIDEIIKEIDILRFTSEYDIVNKSIYIGKDLTYSQIIDKIKSDSLNIEIVDSNDNVVNTLGTVINASNKMNIYIDKEKIDTFTFQLEHLKFDDSLIIDDNKKIIKRLLLGTTYSNLKEKIDTNGRIVVISHDGIVLNNDNIIRTGDKIKIVIGNNEYTYTLSVLGDLTGDGVVEINDVNKLYKFLKDNVKYKLSEEEFAAGDIINDGSIIINDINKLYKYKKERINSLEG